MLTPCSFRLCCYDHEHLIFRPDAQATQLESARLKTRFRVLIIRHTSHPAGRWVGQHYAWETAAWQRDMLRLGQHVRLTSKEVEYFTHITGFAPVGVKRLDDLHAYIQRCKRHYWGTSDDTLALHRMIDDAFSRCTACDGP